MKMNANIANTNVVGSLYSLQWKFGNPIQVVLHYTCTVASFY